MITLSSLSELEPGQPRVATVGIFDGMHRGHIAVLRVLVREARAQRARATVVTFEPHPDAVLRGSPPPMLCDTAERLERFAEAGVDEVVVQRFDEAFSRTDAAAFLRWLGAGAGLGAMVMTSDSAFGYRRQGTPAAVAELGSRYGFRVVLLRPVVAAGRPISSSAIRAAVEEGRLGEARRLLGRRPAVTGRVVEGVRRGRLLGYPTANLGFDAAVCLPPDGIYAVRASWLEIDGHPRAAEGVASLGVRPTFGPGERTLEVHFFGTDEDLYGRRLRVEFVRRQRAERRFPDAAALARQIERDARRARAILATAG